MSQSQRFISPQAVAQIMPVGGELDDFDDSTLAAALRARKVV